MSFKKGAEFIEIMGGYCPVMRGKGTHVWNGSKIVKKTKRKSKKQEGDNERATDK